MVINNSLGYTLCFDRVDLPYRLQISCTLSNMLDCVPKYIVNSSNAYYGLRPGFLKDLISPTGINKIQVFEESDNVPMGAVHS